MKQWKTLLIKPTTPLSDAIAVLDQGGQRIALVVDSNSRLLGTITDGDVRRALIKHTAMDAPVETMMCTTPKTAKVDWNKERILATMEKYELLQMPILDAEQRVIGLQTLHDLLKKRHRDNPVFLMAGGFGSRLHPLTHNCPKPLLKIGDKPILEIIIERFIDAGFHDFFISTHYMHEMIENYFSDGSRWGVSIRYIHEETPLGTAGALGFLPHEEINLPLLVMNADLLTNLSFESLLSFHQAHPAVATICAREQEHRVPYGVIECTEQRVMSLLEKPINRYFINAGIYLLAPELVKSVKPGVNLDMPTLLGEQMAQGKVVNMFPIHEYWLDIGRMEDFKLAQNEIGLL